MLDEWYGTQLFSWAGSATLIMYNTYLHAAIYLFLNEIVLVCNNSTGNFTTSYLFTGESLCSQFKICNHVLIHDWKLYGQDVNHVTTIAHNNNISIRHTMIIIFLLNHEKSWDWQAVVRSVVKSWKLRALVQLMGIGAGESFHSFQSSTRNLFI